jgi:hypothetical protein
MKEPPGDASDKDPADRRMPSPSDDDHIHLHLARDVRDALRGPRADAVRDLESDVEAILRGVSDPVPEVRDDVSPGRMWGRGLSALMTARLLPDLNRNERDSLGHQSSWASQRSVGVSDQLLAQTIVFTMATSH